MKTKYVQQEILLMTGTTFSSRQYCEKDADKQDRLTEKERLEEAAWNGLIKEIMPEIYEDSKENKLFLWQVKEGNSFIELELGEIPAEKDNWYSIDPYSFIQLQQLS